MQESCWARHLYALLAPLNEAAPTAQRRPPGWRRTPLGTPLCLMSPTARQRPLCPPHPQTRKVWLRLGPPHLPLPCQESGHKQGLAGCGYPAPRKEVGDMGGGGRGWFVAFGCSLRRASPTFLKRVNFKSVTPVPSRTASGLTLAWQRVDACGGSAFHLLPPPNSFGLHCPGGFLLFFFCRDPRYNSQNC